MVSICLLGVKLLSYTTIGIFSNCSTHAAPILLRAKKAMGCDKWTFAGIGFRAIKLLGAHNNGRDICILPTAGGAQCAGHRFDIEFGSLKHSKTT